MVVPHAGSIAAHLPVSPEVELFDGAEAIHQGTKDTHSLRQPERVALRWERTGQVQPAQKGAPASRQEWQRNRGG